MDYDEIREKYGYIDKARRESQKTFKEISEIFKKEKEEFSEEDMENLLSDAPRKPHFPIIMFTAAVAKDIVDGLDVTGIGIIITTVISFLLAIALFVWCLGKISGGWWKKRLMKKLFIRFGITILIEFVPGLKIIPTSTIFLLMAHHNENKIVKLFNLALEKMRHAGIR